MTSLLIVYVGLFVLAPLLYLVEQRRPRHPRAAAEARLDAIYWIVTPLCTGTLTRALVLGLFGGLGLALSRPITEGMALWAEPAATIRAWPFALQAAVALGVGDLLGYWSHRLRHRFVWRLHRIHHGAEALTALSAARMHPLDELLDGVLIGLVLLLLGFDWRALAVVGPATLLYTLITHANVDWDWGPLRWLVVSPRFHRVHHLRIHDARSVNFGGVLAIWDVAFGTAELAAPLPADAQFGVDGGTAPTLLGQLTEPLS